MLPHLLDCRFGQCVCQLQGVPVSESLAERIRWVEYFGCCDGEPPLS